MIAGQDDWVKPIILSGIFCRNINKLIKFIHNERKDY